MFPLRAVPKPQHKKLVEINCPCGKTVLVIPSVARKGKKYCSHECYIKNFLIIPKLSKKVERKVKKYICDHCSKEFERVLRNGVGSGKKFCSASCQRTSKRIPVNRNCRNCKAEYVSNPTRNQHFCSKECNSDWIRKYPNVQQLMKNPPDNTGKNNKMYKHGRFIGEGRPGGSSAKKNIKEQLNEIDGAWCIICGKPGPGLHLHRVVYGSHGGKYEINNCVQLCQVHHEEVHSSKKKWFPILTEHIKKRTSVATGTEYYE